MVFIDIYIEHPLATAGLLISFEALAGLASLVSLVSLLGQLSASWRQANIQMAESWCIAIACGCATVTALGNIEIWMCYLF